MMFGRRPERYRLAGFSLTEVLAVAAIVSSIPVGQYAAAKQRAHQTACSSNLQQLGQKLQMYVLSNDTYPEAAFYPKDPLNGDDSLRVILDGKAGPMGQRGPSIWVCPSMPDQLKEKGLTFVYNSDLAGKRSLGNPGKKWVLIEVSCVAAKVDPPHPGGYNILFADGHVISSTRLPKKITAAQKAQIDDLLRKLEGSGMEWHCSCD